MAMSQDETFGPVAGIRRFGDEEEGIRLANDTPYGLAAYFYSRDVGRVWRVGEGLDYGIVGVNTGFVSTEVAPFGGMKESGHRARGLEVRHRGLARDQVPGHGRNRQMRLADRVAIVTGGAQGIGRAIAQRLHEEGATVVVADLQGHEAAAEELGGLGLRVDVSQEADVAALADGRAGALRAHRRARQQRRHLQLARAQAVRADRRRRVAQGLRRERARHVPRHARRRARDARRGLRADRQHRLRARPTRACRSCCTTSRARARSWR